MSWRDREVKIEMRSKENTEIVDLTLGAHFRRAATRELLPFDSHRADEPRYPSMAIGDAMKSGSAMIHRKPLGPVLATWRAGRICLADDVAFCKPHPRHVLCRCASGGRYRTKLERRCQCLAKMSPACSHVVLAPPPQWSTLSDETGIIWNGYDGSLRWRGFSPTRAHWSANTSTLFNAIVKSPS